MWEGKGEERGMRVVKRYTIECEREDREVGMVKREV